MFSGVIRKRDAKEMDRTQRLYEYVDIYIELLNLEKTEFEIQMTAADVLKTLKSSKRIDIIESKAYYESYAHVLSCLQNFGLQTFPFEDLIVYCRHNQNDRAVIWDHDQHLDNKIINACVKYGFDEA